MGPGRLGFEPSSSSLALGALAVLSVSGVRQLFCNWSHEQGRAGTAPLGGLGVRWKAEDSPSCFEGIGEIELCFGGQGARKRRGRGGDNHAARHCGPDAARHCGPFGAP